MDINVTGRKINVGEALTTHIEDRLNSIADKYFNRSIDASVILGKEGHTYRVDVSLHPNQGIKLQSRGEAEDPYASFEDASERIEKQLRRYKRRIKNHHHAPDREVVMELARDSILLPESDDTAESAETALTEQPLIIAETNTSIPRVSVSDAVMMMDLADVPAFMFRNSKNEGLEVVYKRDDGNIGWISPKANAA